MANNSNCVIYLVRHGESEWNKAMKLQGQKDNVLTAKGEEQAAEAAEKLKGIKFDAIFSSDLFRAKRTAEIIKLDRKLEIVIAKALRERTFGCHEGKLIKDYETEIKELLEEYKKLPEEQKWKFKFSDNYESDLDVATRLITFLREIAVAYSGKTILVVTHMTAMRIFLGKIGYIEYDNIRKAAISNGGYIKLISDGVDFKVEEMEGFDRYSVKKSGY